MSDREQRDSDEAWLLAREKGRPGPSISEQSAARYERLEALLRELQAPPARPAGWHERMLAKLQDAAARDTADSRPATAATDAADSRSATAIKDAADSRPATAATDAADSGPATAIKDAADSRPAMAAGAPSTRRRTARRRWPVLAASAPMLAVAAGIIYFTVPRPQVSPEMTTSVEPGDSRRSEPRGSGPIAQHSVGDLLVIRAVVGDSGGELRVYDREGVVRASCKVSGPGCRVDRSDRRTTLVLTMRVETAGTLQAFLFAPTLGTPPANQDADLRAAMQAQHTVLPGELEVFR